MHVLKLFMFAESQHYSHLILALWSLHLLSWGASVNQELTDHRSVKDPTTGVKFNDKEKFQAKSFDPFIDLFVFKLYSNLRDETNPRPWYWQQLSEEILQPESKPWCLSEFTCSSKVKVFDSTEVKRTQHLLILNSETEKLWPRPVKRYIERHIVSIQKHMT